MLGTETDRVEQLTAENRRLHIQILTLKEKVLVEQRRQKSNFLHPNLRSCGSINEDSRSDCFDENNFNVKSEQVTSEKSQFNLGNIEINSNKKENDHPGKLYNDGKQELFIGEYFRLMANPSVRTKYQFIPRENCQRLLDIK